MRRPAARGSAGVMSAIVQAQSGAVRACLMACATPMQPESELETTASSALGLYKRVVKSRPLIQCITNFVSMDIMANVLLAAGASPAMAHSLDEVEDFVGISAALLINMGTLSSDWLASKKLAAKQVSAGQATPVRTRACLDMLRCKPTVVRGNASEILALAGAAGTIKGVDSCESSHAALPLAQTLAQEHQCIVAVSGEVDYVTDGSRVLRISGGDALLTYVTAAGCALTALIAAFVCELDQPKGTSSVGMPMMKCFPSWVLGSVAVYIQPVISPAPAPGSGHRQVSSTQEAAGNDESDSGDLYADTRPRLISMEPHGGTWHQLLAQLVADLSTVAGQHGLHVLQGEIAQGQTEHNSRL
ncbi:hypothetical protein QJQ45_001150 [Haematococcus lacustris]|nr:hypothetical protein QJQ45_001150 [Haematococcus lacustris]